MIPGQTSDPKTQGDAAKQMPATGADPVQPCPCEISLDPSPLMICGTSSKKVKATGKPAGGGFTWSSSDPAIATVTGAVDEGTVKGKKAGKTKIKVAYAAPGATCSAEIDARVCMCTPKDGGSGRYYAFAYKNVADVIGVRAKIKTRYGKVCCEIEDCSTKTGYHVVYANISNSAGTLIWAQSGWGRERNDGSKTIKQYRYAEMNGKAYQVNYDTGNAPAEGSVHHYQCKLDNDTGTWTFEYDGSEWESYVDESWKKKCGTSIQYTGEIFNKEDDMPGTDGDKCEMTECQYLIQSDDTEEEETRDAVLEDFGFDKSDITSEQQEQIDAIATLVRASYESPPEIVKIRLVGHTDPIGTEGYNLGLGQRRALAAREALVQALEAEEAGLSGKVTITEESKGETELADTTGTAAGNAKNRRVEVFLTRNVPAEDWEDAGLEAKHVKSDDAGEWGAEWVSDTALNIWDKDPIS
jgi:outer membrane protein OmpA-like peptidoglycan-associated protein